MEKEDYAEAIKAYKKAIGTFKGDAEVYSDLAFAYIKSERRVVQYSQAGAL